MKSVLRLATRRSKLALTQARQFAEALKAAHPGTTIEEVLIVTSGDRFQDQPLQDLGGKGLFIKEIEQALLNGQADFAVHSIKDVPAELAPGLTLGCLPEREDPRDALVSAQGGRLADLPPGARLGTSSLRRSSLLLRARPDLDVQPLRGNVDTRLRKLDEGQLDAVVLAYAGLRRLGLAERATEVLDPDLCLPAVGQGALGIECRSEDAEVRDMLTALNDEPTRTRVTAERAFMQAVEGNCRLPVAAFAVKDGEDLWLRAMLADSDGSQMRQGQRRVPWPTTNAQALATAVGHALGEELRPRP